MRPPLDVPIEELRRRRSAKWTSFPDDVLPLPVAEMDVRLAPPVAAALQAAVALSDTGYAGDMTGLQTAFAGFAARRWNWDVDDGQTRTCADVAMGVTDVLRVLVRPGDGVVFMPPVYPPFWAWLEAVGATPVEVPLVDPDSGGRLDLDGIGRALEAGARVVLLCHPHNPTGRIHEPAELHELALLVQRYGAVVLSDEIHAPLAHPGETFVPYLAVSAEAAATGIAFHSASKAWNLAGLKCALIAATDPGMRAVVEKLPHEVAWSVGQFGVIASEAAYRDGEGWLDGLTVALRGNVDLLTELLARQLPGVGIALPQAGYLAWLDCRGLGLGRDPARVFLDRGRVALGPGPDFGAPGEGHVRLNLACSPDVLRDAVTRMAAAVT